MTPGSWAYFRGFIVTANDDGSIPVSARIVAEFRTGNEDDKIAMAAVPAMIKALKDSLQWVNVPMQASDAAGLRESIYAAITKAEPGWTEPR